MRMLLAALDGNIKPSGKDWTARCPVHNDKDYAMSIKQNYDGSIMAHCFACGANGVDLYRALNLDLDELFGNKEQKELVPRHIKEQYSEDKYFLAIFNSDVAKGVNPTIKEKGRKRLAEARMKGVERKWGEL